ncbi:MAG: PilZ domain-containing protein [Planctomycetota bacterium]
MTQPTPQSDRRRAPRAAASFQVNLSSESGAEPAALRDISEIGIACNAPAPIDEMTLVGIDFALPGQTDRHQVSGAVVRCERIEDATSGRPQWDIAVYFTEIKPVTKAALKHYVDKRC